MRFILLILLSLQIGAQLKDDAKHVYCGMGINVITATVVHDLTDRPAISIGAGAFAGISAGFAKEYIYDRAMHKGTFSKEDIYNTTWGAVCGTLVSIIIIDIRQKRKARYMNKLKITP